MLFGKQINRYYRKYAPALLLGLLALVIVDYFQLVVPELYQMVISLGELLKTCPRSTTRSTRSAR